MYFYEILFSVPSPICGKTKGRMSSGFFVSWQRKLALYCKYRNEVNKKTPTSDLPTASEESLLSVQKKWTEQQTKSWYYKVKASHEEWQLLFLSNSFQIELIRWSVTLTVHSQKPITDNKNWNIRPIPLP